MLPNSPRYISPRERAETRAHWLRVGYGVAVGLPAAVALMMVGYSDQAPRWLRSITVALDGAIGFPVLWLIQKTTS